MRGSWLHLGGFADLEPLDQILGVLKNGSVWELVFWAGFLKTFVVDMRVIAPHLMGCNRALGVIMDPVIGWAAMQREGRACVLHHVFATEGLKVRMLRVNECVDVPAVPALIVIESGDMVLDLDKEIRTVKPPFTLGAPFDGLFRFDFGLGYVILRVHACLLGCVAWPRMFDPSRGTHKLTHIAHVGKRKEQGEENKLRRFWRARVGIADRGSAGIRPRLLRLGFRWPSAGQEDEGEKEDQAVTLLVSANPITIASDRLPAVTLRTVIVALPAAHLAEKT